MSKKKRVRRDLDKFLRAGRYWELLRLMESEGLVAEKPKEYREAWKGVISQALQKEPAFEEFRREVGTLTQLPNDPDFRLLMSLAELIEGRGSAEEVLERKGLTPEGEKLRSRFAAAFASSPLQQKKLSEALARFIRDPDKITGRYYKQAADLLPESGLAESVRSMGKMIAQARRFNQNAAAAFGWDGVDLGRLEMLDAGLRRACEPVPEALGSILLHPFLRNIEEMCRRVAPEANRDRAVQLLGSIPFLLPRLAGEKLPEIEKKVLIDRAEWLEGLEGDPGALRKKVDALSIEEKVRVLSGVRLRGAKRTLDETNFDPQDFFGDDDDEDDFVEPNHDRADDFPRLLQLLHHSIFKDISGRLSELPPRERKELVRVMEPILLEDLTYVSEVVETADEVLAFLNGAMAAGCAGTKTGLLALLAGARFLNGDLRKRAEKLLDQSPAPTLEDMNWLARGWQGLFYPGVRSLKPLLVRYQNEKNLLTAISAQLTKMVEFALFESALKAELPWLPAELKEIFQGTDKEDLQILRRELVELSGYDALDPLRHFLRCHPKNRMTVEGQLCWFQALLELHSVGVWERILAEFIRWEEMIATTWDFSSLGLFEGLMSYKIEALLYFMRENLEELAQAPADALTGLFKRLLENPNKLFRHYELLIRLEKLCAERIAAGEKGLRPVMTRIRKTLQELLKSEKKASKPGKRKR